MSGLPAVPPLADWPALRRGYDGWPALMREICARHALAASELRPAGTGTNVVFVTDRHVVKLYPPFWEDAAAVERAVLGHVTGRLEVATPDIVAAGHLDAWPYLVSTRLSGVIVADVWNELGADARGQIMEDVGHLLRQLHALPISTLEEIPALANRWPGRIGQATDACVARERAWGVGDAWLAEIAAFLDHRPALCPPRFTPVLVDADVHRWHLVVAESGGRLRLTGLFDFDDAMLGWGECDLAAPAVFMAAGDPAVLGACLGAYGYEGRALDEGLRRRLMTYALLNRYWGLDALIEYGDPDHRCATVAELARALFPFPADRDCRR